MIERIKNLEKNDLLKIIIFLATIISLLSFIFYYINDQVLLYADAPTHLNMARRVVDSLTPGFGQLGGMWLPLFHMLMIPTIWSDFMWHSGMSAYIVNAVSFLFVAYFIFNVLYLLTEEKWISFFGSILLISNPNLIYIQSTAMNETLFVATLLGSAYFLIKWSMDGRVFSLILSGIMIALTSLNRYEGWPICIATIFIVAIISFIKYREINKIEGILIMFVSISSIGMFLWLIWQLVIFNDPFYFLHSVYSSKTQTLLGIAQNSVPTYHNIKFSILTYAVAVANNSGFILAGSSLVGLMWLIINNIYKKNKNTLITLLATSLLIVPFIFECYALYNGNIPLKVPQLYSGETFNIRFGIYTLPAVIVFTVWWISKYRYVKILFIFLIFFQNILFFLNTPILLVAARKEFNNDIAESATYIKNNYKQGFVLISNTVFDSVIIRSNIDMNKFITEGTGYYWDESMINPSKYASWVILSNQKRDMVRKEIKNSSIINRDFVLVNKIGNINIYKKTNK